MANGLTSTAEQAEARPVVKWVGGKRQLLPSLMKHVDRARPFGRYHEPFLGGGALFFALSNLTEVPLAARLTDANPRLIAMYRALRDDVDAVIVALNAHAAAHSKEHYYATRSAPPSPGPALAAWFIYLNKTGFNGLYRVNRQGGFNVPMGSYVNPTICDPDRLRAASRALRGAEIEIESFEGCLKVAQTGDLVYFDPPYVPVSRTASFTSYSAEGFGDADQRRLVQVAEELRSRGVRVLLSNSGIEAVAELYAGFTCEPVQARRAVNSRADRRGDVTEYIIQSF